MQVPVNEAWEELSNVRSSVEHKPLRLANAARWMTAQADHL